MSFWRNKEVKCQFVVCVAISVLWGLAGCLTAGLYGLPVIAACLSLCMISLIFTYRRYRKIAELSADIDRVLHGNETVSFQKYQEGELYVLQDELAKMTVRLSEQAESLKREKSYLADALADISHQLKTPLTSLNLLSASLSGEQVSEKQRLALAQEQVVLLSRMEWLITTLLKISRFDAGAVSLDFQKVCVNDIVAQALRPLAISAELKEQEIVADIPDSAVISADLEWTAQAVGNILKNCIEHTPAGGKIEIAAHSRPLLTELVITDNGSGFTKKDLPHIFERFYQSNHRSVNGAGIGLALAKTIIKNENGTIYAENGDLGGAKFTICFYQGTV
ncbi:MAG: HAMP domain-containing histidine kinase [Roseburia sp.]|nr:HAMP domain-containing histidine kinase [Roseburia sp.]MCM1098456.1 HAMP domain-containing histidine kinase [Ruminococcus flavefaciens]